jgi:PAS domain S-box-containing protein
MAQETQNRFEVLHHISTVLNSSLNLDEVLQNVMDQLIELTHAERGFVTFVDESGELSFPVARNLERTTLEAPEFEVSRTLIRKVVDSRKGELLLSAMEDQRFAQAKSVVAKGLRSVICVPLIHRERVLGVVYVDNNLKAGVFKKEDLETLQAFSNIAAGALENARLYGEVSKAMAYQSSVFESMESGLIAADRNGVITVFNRGAEHIFKLHRTEVIGKTVLDGLHGRAADMFAAMMAEVTSSGKRIVGHKYNGHFAVAGYVELLLNVAPLLDASGRQMGATVVVDDVSELSRLEAERDEHAEERRRLKATLGKLVSEEVADLADKNPSALSLNGISRQVSILFSDLVGFTARAERLPPNQVIEMLNSYFAAMCEVVANNQGTIKQFVGDEIMVLYNAVRDTNDHALYALWTAIDMVDKLHELQQADPEGLHGFYEVKIGVHTGDVVVGAVGTEERMEFAAVGDNVNLCSRVMGLNPRLGTVILISEDCYYEVYKKVPKDIIFTSRGAHMVKGRENPIKVYEVSRASWGESQTRPVYED